MFGLFKKKSEKEKLTELYKKIKEQAYILSKTNRKESDKLEKEASDILEKLDDIDKKNTYIPECFNKDYELCCENYESKIKSIGGVDLQLLGLGTNGHIGFNEPTSSLSSRTRVKTLTENTVANNARFFDDKEFQPSIAVTMGIGTIMDADNIILIGLGKHKSKAVADLVEGPISSFCPGSVLQNHQNVVIVLDSLAASELKLYDYYIHTEKMYLKFMC